MFFYVYGFGVTKTELVRPYPGSVNIKNFQHPLGLHIGRDF